ncbi:MAG: isoamylase early set domain-containing protein, partial [Candidatus Eisenbacteria sp.]|nr:isoamylase early set domain-containing protein [Candidatus Eisenbacteria bacterium]
MPGMLTRVIALSLVALLALSVPVAGAERETGAALKRVTFTFTAHRPFEHVFLAGTFNGWSTDATPMHLEAGRYEVTLLLPTGEYQYKFVADGEWITDEKAKRFLPDG